MAAPQHANARPGSSRTAGPTLKLHRRAVRLRGRDTTVLTLRPVAQARFSTNFFHDTWHVLSDGHGAQVLARLLWGLSYQARPGTMILLDEARLDPNPFDAEPPMLVALVPAGLTGCSAATLRELKHSPKRHAAPDGTVRWRTHGLDLAAAASRAPRRGAPRARVEVCAGVLVISADPDGLRELALAAAALTRYWYHGQSYMEIDYPHGEVQIWRQYHRMVSIARAARAEVLADPATAFHEAGGVRERIWRARGDRAPAPVRRTPGLRRSAQPMKSVHMLMSSVDELREGSRMRSGSRPGPPRSRLGELVTDIEPHDEHVCGPGRTVVLPA